MASAELLSYERLPCILYAYVINGNIRSESYTTLSSQSSLDRVAVTNDMTFKLNTFVIVHPHQYSVYLNIHSAFSRCVGELAIEYTRNCRKTDIFSEVRVYFMLNWWHARYMHVSINQVSLTRLLSNTCTYNTFYITPRVSLIIAHTHRHTY